MRAPRSQRNDALAPQYRISFVVAAFILLLIWFAPNQVAHAYYNDVTKEYYASQDLIPDGGVLTAADIPEGVYIVPAQTSSYMCKLYDPRGVPDDSDSAGKKALEDKCQITVAGGSITATFYISKAYTALYFGSADEAAMSTNDEGTDGSAYWFGTPADGYVYRMISIPVAALNEEFSMATYTGGQSFENGKWYDRTVLLQAGDEVMNAINNSSSGEEPGGDPEGGGNDDPEGGGNGDPEGGGNDDPEGGGNSDPEGGGNDDPEGGENGDPEGGNKSNPEGDGGDKNNPNDNGKSGSGQGNSNSPSGTNSRTNNGGAAAPTKTNDSGSGSNGGNESDAASPSAGGSTAQAQTGATRTRTGIAMSVVKPNDPVVVEVQPLQMPEEKKAEFKITLPFIIACSLALLVAAGVGWRIWGYRRALKAPVPFAEQGTLPERKDA